MTRKQFEALAQALAKAKPKHRGKPRDDFALLVDDIADICAAANPQFDRGRWLAAVYDATQGDR